MLKLFLETQDLDVTVANIVERYDVDEQTARTDASELVADLAARGILTCGDVPA
jgi:hypothetical protein